MRGLMARPLNSSFAYFALVALLAPPGPRTVVATEQHSCSVDGDCMEDRDGEDASALLQRSRSSLGPLSSGTDTEPMEAKLKAMRKVQKLKLAMMEFQSDWSDDILERGLEVWEMMKLFIYQVPNVTMPSDEEVAGALPANITPKENWEGVAQGMSQIMKSLRMEPPLPSAAQVEAACPGGEDCTPSAVVDTAKHQPVIDKDMHFLPDLPSNNHLGACYNAPYYYANACIASKLSPNAKNALVTPRVLKGTTCEDLGYQRWPAFYADPFYGWHNNVSLFVEWGMVEWLPFMYLISSCRDCLISLMYEGWGMAWRQQNPQCAR